MIIDKPIIIEMSWDYALSWTDSKHRDNILARDTCLEWLMDNGYEYDYATPTHTSARLFMDSESWLSHLSLMFPPMKFKLG